MPEADWQSLCDWRAKAGAVRRSLEERREPLLAASGRLPLRQFLKQQVWPLIVEVLLRQVRARVVPFDHDHARTATGAFLRFGRGRHAAAFNFGDCISYAVPSLAGQPLLYIGDDFARTDIAAAA